MTKTSTFLVLLIALLPGAIPAQAAISQAKVEEVVAHFESQTHLIDSLSCVFNQNAIPVLAIVGPEWVRYSMVRDLMETKALELAYVRFGPKAADFSIGPFQMKPSFVEALEKEMENSCLLSATAAYPVENPLIRRRIRIQRMKDPRWQYFYAFAFYSLSQNRFADALSEKETNHIAFIASAYNLGFTRPAADIEKWQQARVFPYGSDFRGTQESYSGVALRFYEALQERRGKVW